MSLESSLSLNKSPKRVEMEDVERWSDFGAFVPMCHDTIYETPVYPIDTRLNNIIRICTAEQYPYLEESSLSLNKSPKRVEMEDVERWSDFGAFVPMCHDTIYETPVYPIDTRLNNIIRICTAEQYPFLEVDVVVFRAPDIYPLSKSMMTEAGKKFRHFAQTKYSLNCGQIEFSGQHDLVGSNYVAVAAGVEGPVGKFANSLDTLVTKTYRRLFFESLESEDLGPVGSIAICGLYPTGECCYEGMQSAFRVMRKVLEHRLFSDLKSVVLCPISSEINELREVLAYYFPRNKNEEQLAFYLPRMNYNEWGEVIKEEKVVKVVTRPGRMDDFNSMVYEVYGHDQYSRSSLMEFAGAASSTENKDKSHKSTKKDAAKTVRTYQRLLIDAKRHQFSGRIQKFIFPCGPNKYGDQTVVLVGQNLPFGDPALINEAFLYFIDFMDHIVNTRFIVIFFCPKQKVGISIDTCREMFDSLDEKYSRNLVNLFIVHSKVMDRLWTWAMTTFRGFRGIKEKVKFVSSLLMLDEMIDISTLTLPSFVYEEEVRNTKTVTARN